MHIYTASKTKLDRYTLTSLCTIKVLGLVTTRFDYLLGTFFSSDFFGFFNWFSNFVRELFRHWLFSTDGLAAFAADVPRSGAGVTECAVGLENFFLTAEVAASQNSAEFVLAILFLPLELAGADATEVV